MIGWSGHEDVLMGLALILATASVIQVMDPGGLGQSALVGLPGRIFRPGSGHVSICASV